MIAKICKNCKWFDSSVMKCHARSPFVVQYKQSFITVWPSVEEGDWCGDFALPDEVIRSHKRQGVKL